MYDRSIREDCRRETGVYSEQIEKETSLFHLLHHHSEVRLNKVSANSHLEKDEDRHYFGETLTIPFLFNFER